MGTDVLAILEKAIAERNNASGKGGAARVAAELGCTQSLISQLRRRIYTDPARKYREIIERYGSDPDVACPTLGPITQGRCAEEKRLPFATTSAAYVRQRRACRQCERGGGKS